MANRLWGPVWGPETQANLKLRDISDVVDVIGVPERIRTSGPRIRNPVLYPAELRGPRQLRLVLLLGTCVIIRKQGIGHNGSMIRDISHPRAPLLSGSRRRLQFPVVRVSHALPRRVAAPTGASGKA